MVLADSWGLLVLTASAIIAGEVGMKSQAVGMLVRGRARARERYVKCLLWKDGESTICVTAGNAYRLLGMDARFTTAVAQREGWEGVLRTTKNASDFTCLLSVPLSWYNSRPQMCSLCEIANVLRAGCSCRVHSVD